MYTDLMIIGVFLVLNILIGLYHAKGVKTFKDYVLGKDLSTFVIVCSLVASVMHIGTLGFVSDCYFLGFKAVIAAFIFFLMTYFGSRILTARMAEFLGDYTMAESIGKLYGPVARKITAATVILVMLGLGVAQLKVVLQIVHYTLPSTTQHLAYWLPIVTGLIVILYSVFGGARSIAMTDVFQFLCFGCTFPLIAFLLLRYAKISIAEGWISLKQQAQFVNASDIFSSHSLKIYFFYGMRVLPVMLAPLYIQRLYMAKSIQKAKKVLSRSAGVVLSIRLFALCITVALYLGGHTLARKHDVIHYFMHLTQIPGIKAIIMITVLALLMSTIDSALHLLSVVFVHDLLPLSSFKGVHASIKKLKAIRITILLVGILALYSALTYKGNVYKLIAKGTEIYIPVVSIPWAMSILGFRPRSAVALITMVTSGIFVLYTRFSQSHTYEEANVNLSIAMVMSIGTLILGHYLLPKQPNTGWVGIKDRNPLDLQQQETKRWWLRCVQRFKMVATKKYWESLFPKNAATFILLGIYLISSTLIALWFMQKEYFFPYIYWYIFVMAIGTILAIYPAFHTYKRGGHLILHSIWPVLLFILLFFSTIQFAKLGHFSPMVCALAIVSIGLGTLLLSLKVGIGMLSIAMIVHAYIAPSLPFCTLFWSGYQEVSIELIFAVTITVATLIGFSFYKYLSDKANVKCNVIELARSYERKAALESIYSQVNWSRLDPTYGSEMLQEIGEMLKEPCQQLYAKGEQKLGEDVNSFIKKLSQFSSLLLQSAKEAHSLGLNKQAIQSVAIEPIILKVHSIIHALGEPMQLLLRNQTKIKHLIADPDLFERYLTINLLTISNSAQAIDHIVTLTITDTTLQYHSTNGMQTNNAPTLLPALAFLISTDTHAQSAQATYTVTDEITPVYLPKTEKQLYQAESRQIVQAHGGYVEIIETQKKLTCLYVLPIAGENVMHFKSYNPADLTPTICPTA
ncbi:sodium:solute symporter family protein [Cardinium endosymbiont of Nabis limbatus]|uniref:sodium:solute symporter family protein n=1 Tax=Cardinium endosymbiont of Nabis limbatus TaxID=3066217 RepID=UPI003AF3472C